jgi:hypothetical protein
MARRAIGVAAALLLAAPLAVSVPTAATASGSIALTRVSGADRFLTAVAVSQVSFPTAGSAKAVVLASGDAFADALAGTPLAVQKGGPLLLTPSTGLTPPVVAEITRVLPPGGMVYVLGGTSVLPSSVDAQLSALGFTPVRLAGGNRFATAVAIAGAMGDPATVFEANGLGFPDGLSAGTAAAKVGGVVLLTNGAAQAPATAAYLAAHPGTDYAVGGPAATADPAATPIIGSDRFATSAMVAQQFFTSPSVAGFASGAVFADALSGGAGIAAQGGPLVIVPYTGALPSSTLSYLQATPSITTGYVYGGTGAVGPGVVTEISSESNPSPVTTALSDIDGKTTITTVSCPTPTFCAAGDNNGDVITFNGSTWSAPLPVFPPADLGIDAISCTASFCMALSYIGGYATSADSGGSWTAPALPPSSVGEGLWGVSCPTATWCMAETDDFGHLGLWESGTWSKSGPGFSLGQSSSPISCVALKSTYCLYVNNEEQYAYYDGTSWTGTATKVPGSAANASAASCTAPDSRPGEIDLNPTPLCELVDTGGFAFGFDGTTWASDGGKIDNAALTGVSCGQTLVAPLPLGGEASFDIAGSSAEYCAAVDHAGNVLYRPPTSGWTAPIPLDGGPATDVSCASWSFCVAVTARGDAIVLQPSAGST